MKIASFNDDRLGLVVDDSIIDVTDVVDYAPGAWPPVGMLRLIAAFDGLRADLAARAAGGDRLPLSGVRLNCPITWPNKLIAFPANYHKHIDEMKAGTGLISTFAASGQGFFLKANSSLSGPQDPIVLPPVANREVHHECELAVVIGKGGRGITRAAAMEHVFGYSCLIDVVIRGREERVMRKSFDSFCPMGPYLVTADEIAAYDDIDTLLTVNGEVRQKANTRDLIVGIPEMIEMASSVMTLYPGDVIASGTPEGVGPMEEGDRVVIRIEGVGAMDLRVERGAVGDHPLWQKPEVAR